MKYNRLPLLATVALGLAAGPALRADENTFAFSDPSQPGHLTVHIAHGEIRVQGADVDAVTVRTDAESKQKDKRRSDGLRVISSSTSFAVEESDNHMVLQYGLADWGEPADFLVTVPRNTSLELRTNYGGEIMVSDIDGNVTVQNLNGEISLSNLGGGAIVESMNGEIEASFTQLNAANPVSITTMNGEVDVTVPADASANVRFRSQNGSILTDFDESVLVTKTTSGPAFAPGMKEEFAETARELAREAAEVAREVAEDVRVAVKNMRADRDGEHRVNVDVDVPVAPRAPRPPSIPSLSGGKVISGTLNDAGEANGDLQIATMNGDIIVRKAE